MPMSLNSTLFANFFLVKNTNNVFLSLFQKKNYTKLMINNSKTTKLIEDFYVDERKLIKKLKEKRDKQQNTTNSNSPQSGQSVRGCLRKILNKNYRTHELLKEDVHVEKVEFNNFLFVLMLCTKQSFFNPF